MLYPLRVIDLNMYDIEYVYYILWFDQMTTERVSVQLNLGNESF